MVPAESMDRRSFLFHEGIRREKKESRDLLCCPTIRPLRVFLMQNKESSRLSADLCAACHASEALSAPSYGTIPPLTTSMHSYHAQVMDDGLQVPRDDANNRAACYRCHPGSATRCLPRRSPPIF